MPVGKLFLYANVALISGIVFGSIIISPSLLLYIIGAFVFLSGIYLFFRAHSLLLALLCVIFCAFGFFRVINAHANLKHVHHFFTTHVPVVLEGRVVSVSGDEGSKKIVIKTTLGKQTLFTYDTRIQQGSDVKIECQAVHANADIAEFALSGSNTTCTKSNVMQVAENTKTNYLDRFRKKLNGNLHELLPSPESALAQGILLGEKQSMPEDIKESFRRTGTSHIVVLSGYNITILAVVLLNMFRRMRFSLRLSIGICLLCIVFFVLLTGVSAPSVRAALMVSVVFLAKMRGRQSSGVFALILSASLMVFVSPFVLGWSLSFQLSFLATLGLIMSERLSRYARWIPEGFGLQENAKTTFAATLFTLPLVAYAFGTFSLVGLVVNCIVLPLVPFGMALTAITLGLSFISSHAAFLFGIVPFIFLRCVLSVINFFSSFSFASVTTNAFSPVILLLSYAGIGAFFALGRTQNKVLKREPKKAPSYFFYGAALFACIAVTFFSFDHTKVLFFDVGQGDAALVHIQGGYDLLVDAGPDRAIVSRLGKSLSYFNRTIERIILTHPHADHIAGLTFVLEKYKVGEVLVTHTDHQSFTYMSLLALLQKKNIPVRTVSSEKNDFLQNKDVPLEIIWPPASNKESDVNDTSIVFKTHIQGVLFLFMGDAGKYVENALLKTNNNLQVDILKVGHHGSRSATTKDFLQQVNPQIGIISVGALNSYGHPDEATLSRLSDAGISIFRTDVCGTIEVVFKSKNEANIRSRCNLDNLQKK